MSVVVWAIVLVALALLILYVRLWRKAPEYAVVNPPAKPAAPPVPDPSEPAAVEPEAAAPDEGETG